jgi:hypothetical protein
MEKGDRTGGGNPGFPAAMNVSIPVNRLNTEDRFQSCHNGEFLLAIRTLVEPQHKNAGGG